jgi:hypothetical protein
MKRSDPVVTITTLGRFCIHVNGKQVATEWPDEEAKIIFCSLLSPPVQFLDWGRLCRCLSGISAAPTDRQRVEEGSLRRLASFLTRELGFNPLITAEEGVRIDQRRIHLDARFFHDTVVEGFRHLLYGNEAAARDRFIKAYAIYGGEFLPGIGGNIVHKTRSELDDLFQEAVRGTRLLARDCGWSGILSEPGCFET